MRTTRLYFAGPIGKPNSIVTLDADASRYLAKVMRYSEGDSVVLFNGDGNNYTASLISTGKSVQVKIEAIDKNKTEAALSVSLVQSFAKGTKLELIIQKATELGVARITPVTTDHSVLQQLDQKRMAKKLEHWNKIAQSACAQCNRSVVPLIDPIIDLSQWLNEHAGETSCLLQPGVSESFHDLKLDGAVNILIGPEGGFSEKECKLAAETGVHTVSCGPRILRTETAGLVSIAIVQSLFGDLR